MRGDYGSLVWVNDKVGRECVCIAEGNAGDKRDLDAISESERATCADTNRFIPTIAGRLVLRGGGGRQDDRQCLGFRSSYRAMCPAE